MSLQNPDKKNALDEAWDGVVGGLDWLKSVLIGEFADNRPLSAVVADMLVSFVPGVVIVTSARDAVAVTIRLAQRPEKREELMEWVLLAACLITLALPLVMAAGGLAAAGVGAIVGGIAGSELGAALRAVMLLLIKEANKLVELVQFLQKFITGDILKFLRAIKFVQYEKVLLQALEKIVNKLVEICRAVRGKLEHLKYFDEAKQAIAKLTEWERKFYAVQQDALKQFPKALAELDARLAKVLAQTAPKEVHTAAAGVQAEKAVAAVPPKQVVNDTAGKPLQHAEAKAPSAETKAPSTGKAQGGASTGGAGKPPDKKSPPPKQPPPPKEPHKRTDAADSDKLPRKDKPDELPKAPEGINDKRQQTVDPRIAADREKITALSKAGKIEEARAVLQPHVDAAKAAKTPAEKQAALDEIVQRLDVSSDKEKMFWSGNKSLAGEIAASKGKTILEQTPGGKVIDDWEDINKTFDWDKDSMPPHGWDLWGDVSENYSKGASGNIEVIQDASKFPAGGPTWKGREWPAIRDGGKVTGIDIYSMDKSGNIVDTMKLDPRDPEVDAIFKGK
jgi:hypothetical protein